MTDFRLRPVEQEDAELILRWRNSDRVRANMYTDHVIRVEEHKAWVARAVNDPTGKYLIFEFRARPVGFVSITGISRTDGRATWAFYLGETDVPRGTGSLIEFSALDYAFAELQIRKLCCEVFAFNASVIRLHKRFGFVQEGALKAHARKNGVYEDVVVLSKFLDSWPQERATLLDMCRVVGGDK